MFGARVVVEGDGGGGSLLAGGADMVVPGRVSGGTAHTYFDGGDLRWSRGGFLRVVGVVADGLTGGGWLLERGVASFSGNGVFSSFFVDANLAFASGALAAERDAGL